MKKDAKNEIIRSSSTTLRFSNSQKIENLSSFIDEYRRVVSIAVDYLWEMEKVPSLLPCTMTSKIGENTWLSARAIQAACKQASGVVRGARKKQQKRLKQVEKFNKQKMFRKARKLQRIYNKTKVSKPKIDRVCPELDKRFVATDLDNQTSFDGWLTLTSLCKTGQKMRIVLPFKKTEHFNKMLSSGQLKDGIRISKNSLTFNFAMKKPEARTSGKTIGADIGIKSLCTLSDGTQFKKDIHGHTLESIQKKLSRKKKGSQAFGQAQKHRTNYIKWFLNQINLDGVRTLNIEDIKHLRKGVRTARYMSHWTYRTIKEKLEDMTVRTGVQLVKKCPTYTSQRCNKCGWIRKTNRNREQFICTACGYTCNADFNASVNISLDLPAISKEERLLHKNRKGFYLSVAGQAPIVPAVRKAS
jgi:transposase